MLATRRLLLQARSAPTPAAWLLRASPRAFSSSAPSGGGEGSSSSSSGGGGNSKGDGGGGITPSGVFGAANAKGSQKLMSKWNQGSSVTESLRAGVAEMQRARKEEDIGEQFKTMAALPAWTFDDFIKLQEDGLKKVEEMGVGAKLSGYWDKYVSGGKQLDTIEEQKATARRKVLIASELNPHERRIPKLIDRKARHAIATKLGVEKHHVDTTLLEYQLMNAQWAWLRRELLRGRPLPMTQSELDWMLQSRPNREFMAAMRTIQEKRDALEKERNRQQHMSDRDVARLKNRHQRNSEKAYKVAAAWPPADEAMVGRYRPEGWWYRKMLVDKEERRNRHLHKHTRAALIRENSTTLRPFKGAFRKWEKGRKWGPEGHTWYQMRKARAEEAAKEEAELEWQRRRAEHDARKGKAPAAAEQ